MTPTTPDNFSRLNLYAVLHSLPDGVTLADADGRIVFSNRAADRILGTAAATEASPDEWAEYYGVFLPDGVTPFPTGDYPLVRAIAGEHTRDVEMVIRNPAVPEGAVISVSGQPLRDDEGEVAGAAVVFRDITELRRTQRLKDELSTFIVHDLKNPLTGILTTCELLLSGDWSSEEARADVQAIQEATDRTHRLVLDLLDVQMAEDGALEIELAPVPVSSLVHRVAEASRARLAARRQQIEVTGVGSPPVLADEPHLFRLLMNLVDNCAKYGPEGGLIRLGAEGTSGGRSVIHVSDEGPGVPPHLRERIFEKYARVEREESSRSGESRGLGLRFCKVVADAHGGRIWVEDAEPRGARFCVELAAEG